MPWNGRVRNGGRVRRLALQYVLPIIPLTDPATDKENMSLMQGTCTRILYCSTLFAILCSKFALFFGHHHCDSWRIKIWTSTSHLLHAAFPFPSNTRPARFRNDTSASSSQSASWYPYLWHSKGLFTLPHLIRKIGRADSGHLLIIQYSLSPRLRFTACALPFKSHECSLYIGSMEISSLVFALCTSTTLCRVGHACPVCALVSNACAHLTFVHYSSLLYNNPKRAVLCLSWLPSVGIDRLGGQTCGCL